MSSSRKIKLKKRQHIVFFGETTSINILDWIVTLLLLGVIGFVTLQLGGSHAETQLLSMWALGILFLFHTYCLFKSRDGVTPLINAYGLIFLPFVGFLIFSWIVLSPVPWVARTEALMYVQAYLVFWITLNSLRTRNHVWFSFAVILLIGLASLLMAIMQYYSAPTWLISLFNPLELTFIKLTGHVQYSGRTTGSFAAPNSFAALMLLMFFPAIIAAFTPRIKPIFRLFCGYLSVLFLFGLAISISSFGLLAIIPSLLLLPWFSRSIRKRRILKFGCIILAIVISIVIFMLWISKNETNGVLFWNESGEFTLPVMWHAALQGFLSQPLLGNGLGSYGYNFEQYRPFGFNLTPPYAHNDYLQIFVTAQVC